MTKDKTSTRGTTTTTKRQTTRIASDSTTILPPPSLPFPPPSCNPCSRGCIPPPTTARTITVRNGNVSLLLVPRVLNLATTMWMTVQTRILRRWTGGGGYHNGNKAVELAAGDVIDDEDVVEGGLAEEVWKQELPLAAIAGVTGKDGKSHYPLPNSPPPTTATSINSKSGRHSMPR